MIIIGIDPGKKGAMAIMSLGDMNAFPFPFIGEELDIKVITDRISGFINEDIPCIAVLEKVHAMPGQGVCSMFTFGEGYGELRGMLKTLGVPLIEPTPQAWKKVVLAGFDWKGNKTASCEYVMKKYPYVDLTPGKMRKPHDGIADAVCLAEYGRVRECGEFL